MALSMSAFTLQYVHDTAAPVSENNNKTNSNTQQRKISTMESVTHKILGHHTVRGLQNTWVRYNAECRTSPAHNRQTTT